MGVFCSKSNVNDKDNRPKLENYTYRTKWRNTPTEKEDLISHSLAIVGWSPLSQDRDQTAAAALLHSFDDLSFVTLSPPTLTPPTVH